MADSEILGEEPQNQEEEETILLLEVRIAANGLKVDTRLSNELTGAIVHLISEFALGSEIDHDKTISGE